MDESQQKKVRKPMSAEAKAAAAAKRKTTLAAKALLGPEQQKVKPTKIIVTNVADIDPFFNTSSRDGNDAANKVREKVLSVISAPPQEYLDDPVYGGKWNILHKEWVRVMAVVAEQTGLVQYTSTRVNMKGGRAANYDVDVMFYDGANLVASRKIEFKYGGTNIDELAQFLSLQARIGMFPETYDKFYYENYIDQYLACDSGITEEKPTIQVYLKNVPSINYAITPFFAQLKSRELLFQDEKNAVVNRSITDYLTKYGSQIDLQSFSEKLKSTQADKIYLLWANEKFCLDKMFSTEMSDMAFHSIKNGNVLQIKSANSMYGLLLRWRNHKGVLNPAWQISVKRQT